ncbi:hypothetical protein BTA51_03990 [Hahella sp. CCB-MM4]|uniref:SDR family oxidoreductase n=1 Tax=Hahella sp. (strain CCB-MM4) TaxID=1926491 RepID=UPI000B9C75ED|nr:SDR family NAD(P)-dependent oxidoreductase [Hahella sp. CCB-MM4]OZG74187.1 hypothetical protein BTA51_03990 [Hahella sp. CCB-MM4]
MKGHVILLTGANRGIGRALLEQLVADNQVIALGRNEAEMLQLQEAYPQIHIQVADLANNHDVQKVIRHIHSEWPDLDMLINNAGIQNVIDFTSNVDQEQIQQEFAINFHGPVELIRGLLPVLRQQQSSHIINVTSVLALAPKHSAPVYCASKAALRHFTQALRYQLRNTSVKVVEVLPPLTRTALHKSAVPQVAVEADWVVQQMIKSIDRGKQEISIGKAYVGMWLHRIMPGMLASMLIKQ